VIENTKSKQGLRVEG